MINDLDEIYKILSLYKYEHQNIEYTKEILNRICEKTEDTLRNKKFEQYTSNMDEYIKRFKGRFGQINNSCKDGQCGQCIINKWCNHYRNQRQMEEINDKGPIYADFFCGAGGLSWGFHRAGFRMSLANDIQQCCIDTITLNHPEIPEKHIIAGDINEVLDNIKNNSRYNEVDVVVGGPPCQGFSMANRQRIIDDPRNHLYKSYIRCLDILKPNFFVMENVRGMLGVKSQIIEDFGSIGYTASAQLLNAMDFGVPQNRERVIFVGNRLGIDNEQIFDDIKEIAYSRQKHVLKDAISELPELNAKTKPNSTEIEDDDSGYTYAINNSNNNEYIDWINEGRNIPILYNHKARYNNERDIEIFRRMNPGDDSSDSKIADIMPYKRREKIFKDKYFRLEDNKPCKTITAHMRFDCNMYIHPSQARGLTPREAARIQSYPDDYFFSGSYTKTYMQVGNSVPPLLGEAIAVALKKRIEEEERNGCI